MSGISSKLLNVIMTIIQIWITFETVTIRTHSSKMPTADLQTVHAS